MKWLVLLSLTLSFWLGVNEGIAGAEKFAERLDNYPRSTGKPSLKVADGDLLYRE